MRRHPVGLLVELFNVTDEWRPWPVQRLRELGLVTEVDALTEAAPNYGDDGNIWLAPYEAVWLH